MTEDTRRFFRAYLSYRRPLTQLSKTRRDLPLLDEQAFERAVTEIGLPEGGAIQTLRDIAALLYPDDWSYGAVPYSGWVPVVLPASQDADDLNRSTRSSSTCDRSMTSLSRSI